MRIAVLWGRSNFSWFSGCAFGGRLFFYPSNFLTYSLFPLSFFYIFLCLTFAIFIHLTSLTTPTPFRSYFTDLCKLYPFLGWMIIFLLSDLTSLFLSFDIILALVIDLLFCFSFIGCSSTVRLKPPCASWLTHCLSSLGVLLRWSWRFAHCRLYPSQKGCFSWIVSVGFDWVL